jgi:hypothetical protein
VFRQPPNRLISYSVVGIFRTWRQTEPVLRVAAYGLGNIAGGRKNASRVYRESFHRLRMMKTLRILH